MSHYTIVGIDPGLIHTGIVRLDVDLKQRTLTRAIGLVTGVRAESGAFSTALTAQETRRALASVLHETTSAAREPHVFVEGYRQRGNSNNENVYMMALITELRRALHSFRPAIIDNTGVKKIVPVPMLKKLELNRFSTASNHQDLLSAARIGIYGALKNPLLNGVLYEVLTGIEDGQTWLVR